MSPSKTLGRFLIWRMRHLPDRQFLLLLSGVVGAAAGLAAVALKEVVHWIHELLFGGQRHLLQSWLYGVLPVIGIVATVLMAKYVFRLNFGHGVSNVLHAISKGSSLIPRRMVGTHMAGSAVTVGLGGSVGLEAPIVVTGSAIGSNIGRAMHLNYKRRSILIGCGASAAIAAIFNAPIAGVIFAMEVLLTGVAISSFIPLLIASVAGAVVATVLSRDEILLSVELGDVFAAGDLPFYILLGIGCGLSALIFSRLSFAVEKVLRLVRRREVRAVVGALAVGLLILMFPPLFGEGYGFVKILTSGSQESLFTDRGLLGQITEPRVLIALLLALIILKAVAASLTIAAGGCGGVFAPSLFIGAVAGYFFASLVNLIYPNADPLPVAAFALVGMCGVMSGMLHAPLTAIFLIAELTGGYELFIPLMLVSAIAYSTTAYFEPHSIYTKRLYEKGDLFDQHNKDQLVLSLIDMDRIVEKDFTPLRPEATLADMIEVFKEAKRNLFPVVDEEGILNGLLTLDDVRTIMFDPSRHDTPIRTLMIKPTTVVRLGDDMMDVMGRFESSGKWNLPVLDEEGRYIGFLSRSKIFTSYRQRLLRQQRAE